MFPWLVLFQTGTFLFPIYQSQCLPMHQQINQPSGVSTRSSCVNSSKTCERCLRMHLCVTVMAHRYQTSRISGTIEGIPVRAASTERVRRWPTRISYLTVMQQAATCSFFTHLQHNLCYCCVLIRMFAHVLRLYFLKICALNKS